jgi:hypothetical protein
LRIYLAGKLQVRWDGGAVYGREFPARQGRRAFAYLSPRNPAAANAAVSTVARSLVPTMSLPPPIVLS